MRASRGGGGSHPGVGWRLTTTTRGACPGPVTPRPLLPGALTWSASTRLVSSSWSPRRRSPARGWPRHRSAPRADASTFRISYSVPECHGMLRWSEHEPNVHRGQGQRNHRRRDCSDLGQDIFYGTGGDGHGHAFLGVGPGFILAVEFAVLVRCMKSSTPIFRSTLYMNQCFIRIASSACSHGIRPAASGRTGRTSPERT